MPFVFISKFCLDNIIYDKEKLRLADEVYRAYGILTNAKIISYKESQILLSYVKLGIDLRLFDRDLLTTLKDFHPYKLLNEINDETLRKSEKDTTLEVDVLRMEKIKESLLNITEE